MPEVIATPLYTGPDRRLSLGDRRLGERRSSFDDVPMVVDRRRALGDRRRSSDRRIQAAMILHTPMLKKKDADVRA